MPKWTEAQEKAIETRGGNILVSAAAGSGKTAVLSARVGKFVEDGGRIDRLLIVTFTNAAAGEMRVRIARELAARAAAKPGDAHLRRQSLTLYKAKICTIDSYGMDLLRRNFQHVGIAPDFSVIDETELKVLQATVLQRQIEEYYRDFPPGFDAFVHAFGGDLDSGNMEKAILTVARKLETIPFADRWLERQKARLTDADGWCRAVCAVLEPIFEEYDRIFEAVLSSGVFDEDKRRSVVEDDRELVRIIYEALKNDDWDEVVRRVRGAIFDRAPAVKGDAPTEAHLYKEYRNRLKDFLQKDLFYISREQCEEDLAQTGPALLFLFDAVKAYQAEVLEEMHRRSAYSFSSLSQLALGLVVADYSHETGEFTPTPVGLAERQAYDEVLIDEYQDVNDLQDLFFRAVSNDNCFAVGDVKQSIYGFRGANSANFLRKKETCRLIPLNKNFRSRKGILDYVNFLCRGLFTPTVGGIEYGEDEMLFPGREDDAALPYPPAYETTVPPAADLPLPEEKDPQPDAELLILPTAGQLREEHYRGEARLCAKLIRDAVEGGATVYDKELKGPRPMEYSDVAILLRNSRSAPLYDEEFRACGIPLLSADGEKFLNTPEVCGILAFLEAINDPWDDLSLFVTLTGSVFSLSSEQMAKARLAAPKRALIEGLKIYAEEDEEARSALHVLEKYRILAENLPIPKLIWQIYTGTDYLALESAANPAARNNLMKFYSFACRYSRSDGLFGFLEFARRAKDSDNVRETGAAPEGKFVRLTTIHKSKGLEYAWCILPELERPFKTDTDKVRVDTEYGVASKVKNESETAEYSTLMRELIIQRADRSDVAEELRVLYVALTRARDRLTMICRCNADLTKLADHGLHSEKGIVRYIDRLETNSYRTPILDRTVTHPDAGILHTSHQAPETAGCPLRVCFAGAPETVEPVKKTDAIRCGLSAEELNRRFTHRYNGHLSTVPAKVSVTEIAKSPADPDSALLIQEPPLSRPKFLDEEALTGAEAGTAIHTYCQFADFEKPVKEEIERLTAQGHLTEASAKAVDPKMLEKFLQGSLMETLRNSLGYRREVRFVCKIPVSYYSGNPGEEGEMLMQGAIDLLCETEEGYLIVDFKSDRATEEELLERYSRQLNLYAAAVRRLYDKPVIGCRIWSFRLGKEITVKEEEM